MSTDQDGERNGTERFRFGDFVLDVADRQLWRGDTRIDLNARYLDALALLVRERGRLVPKDRFFDEVWSGVVVSDSALTQCIKEIRKQLGDDASDPRYVQTVSRHGYRFIADTEAVDGGEPPRKAGERRASGPEAIRPAAGYREALRKGLFEWGGGTLGGGLAGLAGGMLYGYGLASAAAGVGTLSTLLVLVLLCVLVGLAGGFGVAVGLAGAHVVAHGTPKLRVAFRIAGAAAGGLVVGSAVKFIGVDAFNLLFGRAPAGITGGPEGAALGAALAVGAFLGDRIGDRSGGASSWHAPIGAGIASAATGALIPLAGGRLMGGSLDLLAKSFADSRLQLDTFAPLFGELHFGVATQAALGSIEGLLFGTCVVGALALARRMEGGGAASWKL